MLELAFLFLIVVLVGTLAAAVDDWRESDRRQ